MSILDAIITVGAAILSAVATFFLTMYFDKRKERYEKASHRLKDVVNGKWKGRFEQILNNTNQTFDLFLELKVLNSGAITGKAKVPYNGESFELNIKGGFYSHRFLKMDYENSDRAILQFGSFVFKLSDNAQKLVGYFVGYGHISGKIIGGNAFLDKV